MGLFDSSKTYYYSSTVPLIEEVPGFIDQTIRNAIAQNRNIAEDIGDNLVNSIAIKGRSYYNYGKSSYTRGLPEGTARYLPEGSFNNISTIIELEIGSKIEIGYIIYDDADAFHWAQEFIHTNRGWDEDTNEVTNPPFDPNGNTVYFDDADIIDANNIRINYAYNNGTDDVIESETISAIPPINLMSNYYYVLYYEVGVGGARTSEAKFWRYALNDNTYPHIKPVTENMGSPYFPIVPLREYEKDLTNPAYRNEALYQSSKNLLRILGMDIDDLSDSVHGRTDDNPNWNDGRPDYWVDPEYESIDHIYVIMAVEVDSGVELSIEYMYRYFDYLRVLNRSQNTKESYDYWYGNTNRKSPPPTNTIVIEDTDYRMELTYYYIDRTIKTGNIGKVGSFKRTTTLQAPVITGWFVFVNRDSLILQYQFEENRYYELVIHGLQHTNYIYEDHIYVTTLAEAFDEEDDQNNFLIPLHIDVLRDMGVIKTHDIYYDSLRLIMNTRDKVDTGFWGSFGAQLIIFVASVISYGWVGAIVSTIVQIIAQPLFEGIIKAFNAVIVGTLVDIFGEELAYIVTVVIAAIGVIYRVPYAQEMLSVATSAVQLNINEKLADKLKETAQELKLLEEEEKEIDELLSTGDNVLDLLGFNNEIDYNPITDTPGVFYDLAIHETNPGVISLDAIGAYVDTHLILELPPTLIRTKVT